MVSRVVIRMGRDGESLGDILVGARTRRKIDAISKATSWCMGMAAGVLHIQTQRLVASSHISAPRNVLVRVAPTGVAPLVKPLLA